MKNHIHFSAKVIFAAGLICALFSAYGVAQKTADKDLTQAFDLFRQNHLVDALPFFDKVGPKYLENSDVQAQWGVTILANSVTIKEKEVRKQEITRAGEILRRAKKLGTRNVLALHYLDLIEQGIEDIDSVSRGANKDVEGLIRDGEGFFGRGDYDKAFQAYEKAYKLDPKSYQAALFAGDCFYSQKRFKESELWFGRAVTIDPDQEQAYRFWGDALAEQGNGRAALEKFAESVISSPGSRVVIDRFVRAIQQFGRRKSSPFILIPTKDGEDEIVIDVSGLTAENGSTAWKRFSDVRTTQIAKFKAKNKEEDFESGLADDLECLRAVIVAAREMSSKDRSIKLNKSLENLIQLDAQGTLDIYVMLFLQGEGGDGYDAFRAANRQRMLRFLIDYFADDAKENTKVVA